MLSSRASKIIIRGNIVHTKAAQLYPSKTRGMRAYEHVFDTLWLHRAVRQAEREKEKKSNRMTAYVTAMHVIDGTKTKKTMLQMNCICSGPATGKQDAVLLSYEPSKVARLGFQDVFLKLSNLSPQAGKDKITHKQQCIRICVCIHSETTTRFNCMPMHWSLQHPHLQRSLYWQLQQHRQHHNKPFGCCFHSNAVW